MIEAVLMVGLFAGLPIIYFRGKRSGFERHNCVWFGEPADRAPQSFVTVNCGECGEGIDCELHVERGSSGKLPTLTATVDSTDLEHHALRHDEARHPLP